MAPFLYRCPATDKNVQGWLADEIPSAEGKAYQSMTCLACRQVHFVHRATQKVLGADDE